MNKSIKIWNGWLGKSSALRKVVECILLAILLIGSVSAATLTVSPDGIDSSVYTKIQDAINASNNGDTINVGTGTYIEQLDINKSITIVGIGTDESSVIVQSPSILATKFVTTGPNNNKPIVFVNNTTGVIIQKLTVNGSGLANSNYRMQGIAFYNAGGTVDHVTIKGIRETPLSGGQQGVGLYAYNVDSVARTLNVTNNTIYDFQKNGMALSGTGLTVNVHDNTVTGAGPTSLIAQNGIQVSFGATGIIGPNNVVSNVSYTGPSWASSGILVYIANADVLNNTVNNAQVGIYFVEGNGLVYGNTVTGSASGTGNSAYWGIDVADPPQAKSNPVDDNIPGTIASGTMTVNVTGNTLTGSGDSASSVGLEADAGYYGTLNITFNATNNIISGWGYGVEVSQCISGCTGSIFDSIKVNHNNISSNTINMDANVSSDGTKNWWGTAVRSAIVPTITGSVTFDPYYIDSAMTTLSFNNVWAGWSYANGQSTRSPSISMFNSKLYAMVSGTDDNLYINSMDTSGVWSGWSYANNQSTRGPGIATFNGKLYAMVSGTDNNLYINSLNTSGVWSGWSSVSGQSIVAPSITSFNGSLYAMVTGTDNNLYINSMNTGGIWSGWSYAFGQSTRGPSIATFNGKLYAMVSGTDNNLYTNSMNTGGTWSGWSYANGQSTRSPSITSFSINGKLYAMVSGTDNNLYTNSMDTSGVWSGWSYAFGQSIVGPSITEFNSRLYAMASGTDNNLYINYLS